MLFSKEQPMARLVLSKYNSIFANFSRKVLTAFQFNRPKSLNSFGGKLMEETVAAIRELNDDPTSIFTVLTGSGRFFSAGADVRSTFSLLLFPCCHGLTTG
jgi:peroxisomal 3,2-trans-enoyl-CoA isomerase